MENANIVEVSPAYFPLANLCVELAPEQREGRRCQGCSLPLYFSQAVRVPGIAGIFCSLACAETHMFGRGHCRWCGADMDTPHQGVGSRLCSEDCSESYHAHVLGDRTARLGTGKRLALWLQAREAERKAKRDGKRTCENCGASIDHFRRGTRFCSAACKMQDQRKS